MRNLNWVFFNNFVKVRSVLTGYTSSKYLLDFEGCEVRELVECLEPGLIVLRVMLSDFLHLRCEERLPVLVLLNGAVGFSVLSKVVVEG